MKEIPEAFPDWDFFISEFDEMIKNYKNNYEKLTGNELEEDDLSEDEDREIKPYYVMNDFEDLLAKKEENGDGIRSQEVSFNEIDYQYNAIGHENKERKNNGENFEDENKEFEEEKTQQEDKNLFGNKELLRFFGLEHNHFKVTDETEKSNQKKTIKFIPAIVENNNNEFNNELQDGRGSKKPSVEFLGPTKNKTKNWNDLSDEEDEKGKEWKPFVVGKINRKSANLEGNEDEFRERNPTNFNVQKSLQVNKIGMINPNEKPKKSE